MGFQPGLEVYIIPFDVGIDVENGVDSFWRSLCRKMQTGYPSRFPLGEEPASYMFQKHFRRAPESRPVVLLFDDVSLLVNHDPLIVHDFIGMLRLPRDGRDKYCMHSFVLAGVETIKKLLVPQSGSMGRISPFTQEATIVPGRFTEADIKTLLDDYSKGTSVHLYSASLLRIFISVPLDTKASSAPVVQLLKRRSL